MSDPLDLLQNGNDGGQTPPAAPEPPASPVDGSGDNGALNTDEQSEAAEWEKAAEDLFPGLKEGDKGEQTELDKKPEKDDAGKENPPDKKPDAEQKDGAKPQPPKPDAQDDGSKDNAGTDEGDQEDEPPEPTELAARLSERERQQQVESVRSDIREKMFKSVPTELRDADGDPIKSIDDVMRLINPRTGKAFTEEEAGMWLLQAQSALRENAATIERQIEAIADTNLTLKDEADMVNYQYGELLRAMPELREQIWKTYEQTLEKDANSGIITKARVSLQKFYETALEPYAQLGRQLEAQESQKAAADTQVTQAAKQQDEQAKQQRRQDRSDIYGGGKVDTLSDEDKEWADAAKAVFGDQLR